MSVFKNCVVCGDEFQAAKRTITCSLVCSKERDRTRDKERRRTYYQTNHARLSERQKIYRMANREKIREQERRRPKRKRVYRYDANPEKRREYSRKYYYKAISLNPDKIQTTRKRQKIRVSAALRLLKAVESGDLNAIRNLVGAIS